MKKKGLTFEKPWLLLCEGQADKSFLDFLIAHFAIHPEKIKVMFPGREGEHSGGKSKFAEWLRTAHDASIEFRQNVTHVVIIADNDEDPKQALADVLSQLKLKKLPTPSRQNTLARMAALPSIMVHMIPDGKRGGLETLWLPAAYRKSGLQPSIDQYVVQTPANSWTLSKQEKMRAQVLVASMCEELPQSSFANHWQKMSCVDADDAEFKSIVTFLRDLDKVLV